jgi:hypothetical protein
MKLAERRGRRNPARTTLTKHTGSKAAADQRPAVTYLEAVPTRSLPERAGETLQACQTGPDRFDLNALVGQIWLVQLREHTEVLYNEPPKVGRLALQSGFAWRSFARLFEPLSAIESVRLFENLLRFANYEAYPPARAFFLAYAPLSFEHDISGEYIGPGVWTPDAGADNAALRVRRTLERWCQWMEALAHFQVHDLRHSSSVHRQFDKLVILLWPLVVRHDLSCLDLLNLLRSLGKCGNSFPCPSEGQLADYCQKNLGLYLTNRPSTARGEPGAAHVVAERLFNFLPAIS